MTSGPLFTIATLCYNHEPFLDDYFKGLLAQTYSNIQLIIHDDRSTDNSWEKIQHYLPQVQKKFSEVICVQSEVNRGMWGSYLWLINPCRLKGKYFSILESDDFYFPSRIEKLVTVLEATPDLGLVHSSTLHYVEETRRFYRYRAQSVNSGYVFQSLLQNNFINQCSIAFRSSVFRQIDIEAIATKGYPLVDYAVSLAVSRLAPVGYVDEPLAVYRVRNGSASRPADRVKRLRFDLAVMQVALDTAIEAQVDEAMLHQLRTKYYRFLLVPAFAHNLQSDFCESLQWLRNNNPSALRSIFHRIFVLCATNSLLQRPFQRVYAAVYGSKTYRRLGLLKVKIKAVVRRMRSRLV